MLRVNPLSEFIGAEIQGLDLSRDVDQAVFKQIREVWLKHIVLVFRGQRLSDQQLVTFSGHFGKLDFAPPNEASNKGLARVQGMPEVTVISNVIENGVPIGALGDAESEWHTDMSYNPVPPTASLLYSLEIPSSGGDTSFANMYAAYETLPVDVKNRIAGRLATHDATYTSAGGLRKGFQPVDDVTKAPGARHPIVRTHPETGRNALFLGRRRNSYIIGMAVDESEQLLDRLWTHATQARFTYRHRWQVGDLLVWDNRCAMHQRDSFDSKARRVMHRTQIKGDSVPIQAAEKAA
jgi:taurine dioxygenase